VDDEAQTPADLTNAAHCNDRNFGTSRWQLSDKITRISGSPERGVPWFYFAPQESGTGPSPPRTRPVAGAAISFPAGAELASVKETHCGLTISIAVPSKEGGTPQIAAGYVLNHTGEIRLDSGNTAVIVNNRCFHYSRQRGAR
jgi:hypothetical protein